MQTTDTRIGVDNLWARFSSPFSDGGIELKKRTVHGKTMSGVFSGVQHYYPSNTSRIRCSRLVNELLFERRQSGEA
jgi:hypothetical protein